MLSVFSLRRFIGYLSLLSYLFGLLSPTLAQIPQNRDPLQIQAFDEGITLHAIPAKGQNDFQNVAQNLYIKMNVKGDIEQFFDKDCDSFDHNNDSDISSIDHENSEDASHDEDQKLPKDSHDNDDKENDIEIAGKLYQRTKKVSPNAITDFEDVFVPGLKGIDYAHIQELYDDKTSAGISCSIKGIGYLHLLWDGSAFLVGDSSEKKEPLSLELTLSSCLHVSNVDLALLTVHGTGVHFSDENKIGAFSLVCDEKHPQGKVTIDENATLKITTLLTNQTLENKGCLSFAQEGHLSLQESLFLNTGHILGDYDLLMDGISTFKNEGVVDLPFLRTHCDLFDNKGIITVQGAYLEGATDFSNKGKMKASDTITLISSHTLTNSGQIKGKEVVVSSDSVINKKKDFFNNDAKKDTVGTIKAKEKLRFIFKEKFLNEGLIQSDNIFDVEDDHKGILTNHGTIKASSGHLFVKNIINGDGQNHLQSLYFDQDVHFRQDVLHQTDITNNADFFIGEKSSKGYIHRLENFGNFVSTSLCETTIKEYKNAGLSSFKGKVSVSLGENRGELSIDDVLTITRTFTNAHSMKIKHLRGRGELTNTGCLEFTDDTLSEISLRNVINKGKIAGSSVLITSMHRIFSNDEKGSIVVNKFILDDNQSLLPWVNEGHIKADDIVFNRKKIHNDGSLDAQTLTVSSKDFINETSGDIKAKTFTMEGQILNNHGDMTVHETLSGTVDNITNNGVMTLNGDGDIKGDTLKNTKIFHAKKQFSYKGKNFTNSNEFRAKNVKIYCIQQVLNTQNFQVMCGNIAAWHTLNTGIYLGGGDFKTDFPKFEPPFKDVPLDFKHGTGFENFGLFRTMGNKGLRNNLGSIKNAGAFDVTSFEDNGDSFINTKTGKASFDKIISKSPVFENHGQFMVKSHAQGIHEKMTTSGTTHIKGKATFLTQTWDQTGDVLADHADLVLTVDRFNNNGTFLSRNLVAEIDSLINQKTIRIFQNLTGSIKKLKTTHHFFVGKENNDPLPLRLRNQKSDNSLALGSLENTGHCYFLETEKPLNFSLTDELSNDGVLTFSSRHQKTTVKKLSNTKNILINLMDPFYSDDFFNDGETILESAPFVIQRMTNTTKGILSLQGKDNYDWSIVRGKTYHNKAHTHHTLITSSLLNMGKIECTGSLESSASLTRGHIAVKDELIYHFDEETIDGSEFQDLTVEGVLSVYANNFRTKQDLSFNAIKKIVFHLKGDANIDNNISIDGLEIRADRKVSVDKTITTGTGGVNIKGDGITISKGKIESKGPINLTSTSFIGIGKANKNCISDAPNGAGLKSEGKITLKAPYLNLNFGTIQSNKDITYDATGTIDHIAALTESCADIILFAKAFYHGISGIYSVPHPDPRLYKLEGVTYDYPRSVQSMLHALGTIRFTGKSFTNYASTIIAERGSRVRTSDIYYVQDLELNNPLKDRLIAQFFTAHNALFYLGRGIFGGMTHAGGNINIKALDDLIFKNPYKERDDVPEGTRIFDVTDFAEHLLPKKYQRIRVPLFKNDGQNRIPQKQQIVLKNANPDLHGNGHHGFADMELRRLLAMNIGRLLPMQGLIQKVLDNSRKWLINNRQAQLTYEDLEQLDKTIVYVDVDEDGTQKIKFAVPDYEMNIYQNAGDVYAGNNMGIISQKDIACRNARLVALYNVNIKGKRNVHVETGMYTVTYGDGQSLIKEERSRPKALIFAQRADLTIDAENDLNIDTTDLVSGSNLNLKSKKGHVKLQGRLLKREKRTTHKDEETIDTETTPTPITVVAGGDIDIESNEKAETYVANAHLKADKNIRWRGGHTILDAHVGHNVRQRTVKERKIRTRSTTSTPVFASVEQEAGEDILFGGEKATLYGGKMKAKKLHNKTKEGMTIEPKVAVQTHTVHNEKKGLFGTQKSGGYQWQEVGDKTTIDVPVVDTRSAPLHLKSVVMDEEKTTFLGEYIKTTYAFKSGGSTYAKATGIFNPGIAAVVALGIGLASQGWGTSLTGGLGLAEPVILAVEAGITTMCIKTGLSLLQNDFDPKEVTRDVANKKTLVSVLKDMATAAAVGALGGQKGAKVAGKVTKQTLVAKFAEHFQKGLINAGIKAAVQGGFQLAQGEKVKIKQALKDILVRGLVDGIGAAGANEIGGLYKDEIIDPITHKGLHAALGALEGAMLNGVDGAKAGASAAVIAESLGDLVKPSMEETFAHLREQYPDREDFDTHVNAYLTMQKDLIQLATAGILAGRGMDVDTAIIVSDNALTHNWMETALENAAHYATDLALENPENLEEIKQHILDEVPLEALENLASWVEANPDKVAMGVTTLMGAMDRNAEDRGAPSKDSKAQRRAKEKILTKAITQSPALLKDMLAKAKGGVQGVAAKKGVEKVAVQPNVKEAPKDVAKLGERIRKRAPQKNVVPMEEDHLVEGREWKTKIIGKAQKTGTDGHAFRSYREAIREAKKPDTEKVFLNLGVNRAAEHPLKPNRRPDVTVLKKDGRINQIEVPSKTDKIPKLNARMEDTRNRLPKHQRGEFRTKDITKEVK